MEMIKKSLSLVMLLISFSGSIFADQCDSYIKKKNYEKAFVVSKE